MKACVMVNICIEVSMTLYIKNIYVFCFVFLFNQTHDQHPDYIYNPYCKKKQTNTSHLQLFISMLVAPSFLTLHLFSLSYKILEA